MDDAELDAAISPVKAWALFAFDALYVDLKFLNDRGEKFRLRFGGKKLVRLSDTCFGVLDAAEDLVLEQLFDCS